MDSIFQNNQNGDPFFSRSQNEMQKVGNLISCATGILHNDIANLENKIDGSIRKQKRKIVRRDLGVTESGEMFVLAICDDGTRRAIAQLTGIRGPVDVRKLKIQEADWEIPLFSLYFEGSQERIVGQTNKAGQPAYLYDVFLRLGIRFLGKISVNDAKRVLYEAFISEIFLTQNTESISALAGWHNKLFMHANKYPLGVQEGITTFPVQHKKFPALDFREDTGRMYFREMRQIADVKERFMIMVYPFIGILASIFSGNYHPLKFGINIVALSGWNAELLCDYMQIFNRDFCSPISSDISEKKLKEMIRSIRDEVIILDCRENEDESYYEREKKRKRCQRVFRKVLDERKVERRNLPICAGVCTVSSKIQTGKNVYNIIPLDEKNRAEEIDFRESKVMDRVLSEFVKYAEKYMDEILEIIRKKDRYRDERECVLYKGGAILEKFWASKGVDFWDEAGIDKRMDFQGFFSENAYDEEELQEFFIRCFRKGVSAYTFVPRNTDMQRTDLQIHFDGEWLWVPTGILSAIMKTLGRIELTKILLDLKEKQILKTDLEGLSRRTVIAGERREVYQIRRQFFNKEGDIDVVALGGESNAK